MRALSSLALALLTLLVPTQLALAQGYPARVGALATDSFRLDGAAIDRAASTLADLGVEAVALYIEAPLGSTLDDAEDYFEGALIRYGLAPDQSYIIVFVGTSLLSVDGVRPLFIEIGERLESRLGDPAIVDVLRSAVVAPRLLANDPTGAFSAAFEAVAEALTPLTPGALEQRAPSEPLPRNEGRRLPWELVLLAVLALLALLRFRRRSRRDSGAGPEVAAELQRVKGELSSLLIDLSSRGDSDGPSDPYLPSDPEQQTDFVLIRDFLEGDDSGRVAALLDRYRLASSTLAEVESGFEALRAEEEASQQVPDLFERYRGLLTQAEGVRGFVDELAELWRELQAEAETVPERIQQLRRRVAVLRAALTERFGSGLEPDRVLVGVTEALEQADREAGANGVAAARILDGAEVELELLERHVEQLSDVAEGLADMAEDLDAWQAEGFDTEAWRSEREAQLKGVQRGVAGLAERSPEASEGVAAAVATAQEFVAQTETLVALQRRNAARLDELRLQGERVRDRIEQGALAFDAVDDFAEPNWRDVRGNGTEAQKSADRAQELFERAANANALRQQGDGPVAAPEGQDFAGAAAALDAAFADLDQAELLVQAIVERLETLREARATARRLLEAVESDLAAHEALLKRPEVDRDVGTGPGQTLVQARQFAAEARTALETERPDWLAVMARIQDADRVADAALAAIRDEQGAMEHRRLRMVSERDETAASWTRLDNYLKVHGHDLTAETVALAKAAGAAFEAASSLASRSDVAQEGELAALLDESARAFDDAQQQADGAFAAAEAEFAAAELLRSEVAADIAAVEADLDSFRRYLHSGGVRAEMRSTLQGLERSVPRLSASASRDDLERSVREVAGLRSEIDSAMVAARRLVERRESALRRERQARLEAERRRRAAEAARQAAPWGASASPSPIRPPRAQASRSRIPTVGSVRPAGKRASPKPRRSSGSWGGAKRSKGGW